MNEQEFRDALRTTMSATAAPPPMGEASVLDAAKRERSRRRALWAGAGSAAAVVAIAVGVVVVAPSIGGGEEDGGLGVGGAPPSVASTDATDAAGSDPDKPTETEWPNGQSDRTQTSGPRADQGVTLLTELEALVPAGFETPDDLKGTGDLAGAAMRFHQAQYADTVDGVEVWEYMADVAVTKGDGVGRLLAQVTTPGGRAEGEGCELFPAAAWSVSEGGCTDVVVDGRTVGVYTISSSDPVGDQFDQWAAYRHDDGTVVSVAQATHRAFTDFPPLSGPVFTAEQLAELAADPRFHLD